MANEEQLNIIRQDGVRRWNSWVAQNRDIQIDLSESDLQGAYLIEAILIGADLSNSELSAINLSQAELQGANLSNTNIQGGNFSKADLENANLSGSRLQHSKFIEANLKNVNFENCEIQNCVFDNSDISDANFRGCSFGGAKFTGAKFNSNTLGIGLLPQDRQSTMAFTGEEPVYENVEEISESESANNIQTVGYATQIISSANVVLQGLSIPNDMEKGNLELFNNTCSVVGELNELILVYQKENERLICEIEALNERINSALPLWKQTWMTFVAGAGGAVVGNTASYQAGYAAGFISGILHDTFAVGDFCIT